MAYRKSNEDKKESESILKEPQEACQSQENKDSDILGATVQRLQQIGVSFIDREEMKSQGKPSG